MTDMIAMLDGFSGVERTTSPSGGQNYSGGATWFPGTPTQPSGTWGLAAAPAGAAAALAARGYDVETVQPGGGQNHVGGATWFPGSPTLVSGTYGLATLDGDLARYLAGDQWGYQQYGVAGYGGLSASVERTTSPSGGQNYSGGATWSPGFPVLPTGSWGLARAMDADPIGRLIRNLTQLLGAYGGRCAVATDRLLVANREAERYSDWLHDGFGDPALRRRAKLVILRALSRALQSVIVDCRGVGAQLDHTARRAVAMAYSMTGDPTNA